MNEKSGSKLASLDKLVSLAYDRITRLGLDQKKKQKKPSRLDGRNQRYSPASLAVWGRLREEQQQMSSSDRGRKQNSSPSSWRNEELCTDTRLGCHHTGAYLLTAIFRRSHTMRSGTNKPLWSQRVKLLKILRSSEQDLAMTAASVVDPWMGQGGASMYKNRRHL